MKEVSFNEFEKFINRFENGLKIIREGNYTKVATEYYYRNNKLIGLIKIYFFIGSSTEHKFWIKED